MWAHFVLFKTSLFCLVLNFLNNWWFHIILNILCDVPYLSIRYMNLRIRKMSPIYVVVLYVFFACSILEWDLCNLITSLSFNQSNFLLLFLVLNLDCLSPSVFVLLNFHCNSLWCAYKNKKNKKKKKKVQRLALGSYQSKWKTNLTHRHNNNLFGGEIIWLLTAYCLLLTAYCLSIFINWLRHLNWHQEY